MIIIERTKPTMEANMNLKNCFIVFDAYDDNRDGIIDIQYLGVVMRASGLILTDKDIVNITRDADPEVFRVQSTSTRLRC